MLQYLCHIPKQEHNTLIYKGFTCFGTLSMSVRYITISLLGMAQWQQYDNVLYQYTLYRVILMTLCTKYDILS